MASYLTFLRDASTRHSVFVERFAGGQLKQILPYLERARKVTAAELAGKNISAMSRARLQKMYTEIEGQLNAIYTAMGVKLTAGLKPFAQYEAEFTGRMLGEAIDINFAIPSPNQVQAAAFSRPMDLLTDRIDVEGAIEEFGKKKSSEIVKVIKSGVILGKTSAQLVDDVSFVTNKVQRNHAESLVRTVTAFISSEARREVINANQDIVEREQWVSTLDGRTTAECFLGETMVFNPGDTLTMYKANYAGDIVTMTTKGGAVLRGTPNHPILTDKGYVPLGKLKLGFKVAMAVNGVDLPENVPYQSLKEVYKRPGQLNLTLKTKKYPSKTDFSGDGASMYGELEAYSNQSMVQSAEVPPPSGGKFQQVVRLQREFMNTEVYTLGSTLGFYFANGIVVKNCQALDGQTFDKGEGPQTPLHWGCRSTRIPIVSPEYQIDVEGQFTRPAVGAEGAEDDVKSNATYNAWLKTQPAAFQDEVLGATRGQLFREGGLSVKDFVDENYRQISLEELREKESMAFERAGLK